MGVFFLSKRQVKVWIIASITLGFWVYFNLLFYYQANRTLHFAFASDQSFKVQLNERELDVHTNGLVIAPTLSLPFTQIVEEINANNEERSIKLNFNQSPQFLKVIRYQKLLSNPFKLVLYHYYALLPCSIKAQLLWFNEIETRIKHTILQETFFSLNDKQKTIDINDYLSKAHPFKEKFLNFLDSFWLYFLSFLSAMLVTLPFLLIRKAHLKAIRSVTNQVVVLLLLTLLAFCWGIYTYNLLCQTGFFSISLLRASLCLVSIFFWGFIFHASLIIFVMNFIASWPFILRSLVVLIFLSLDIILLIQAGFLYFTANYISQDYFGMLDWQVCSFLFSPCILFFVIFIVALSLYLLNKQTKKSYSLSWLFFLYPFFWLFSCVLSFGKTLPILQKGVPVAYCVAHPMEKLSFSSYLEPFLDFLREGVRYYKLSYKLRANDSKLEFKNFSEHYKKASQSYELNLGKELSYYPAGKRPFRRIILLTIEGYRLAYIPQYNTALKGIMRDYPFFSREEVQKAFIPNYYACATYTMRGLLTLLTSHMNTSHLRQNWRSLSSYPSLPRLLRERGFSTFFIQTVSEFEQFDSVFKATGIQRYLDLKSMDFITHKEHLDAGLDTPYTWLYPSRLLFKEVIGQLKKAQEKNTDIFTLIINTDTHVPPIGMAMSRPDCYGNLVYPDPSFKKPETLSQDIKNTLISTYRFAYDLDLFFEQLKHEGLWDEDTLLIITADHSQLSLDPVLFPKNELANRLDALPLFILSPRPLPTVDRDIYSSHLDLAPTILDLMGLDKPVAYWGSSLYRPKKNRQAWFIAENGKTLYSLSQKGIREWPLAEEKALKQLFDSFFQEEEAPLTKELP